MNLMIRMAATISTAAMTSKPGESCPVASAALKSSAAAASLPRRFLMEPPPALTSARYATDFNETKELGAVNSTTRTADQTLMARTWHGVGTTTTSPNVWNT